MRKILILGASGQLGSELIDKYLVDPNNIVYGMVRRSATGNFNNIQHNFKNDRFNLVRGDITDPTSLNNLLKEVQPDLIINTAAQSHVHVSFEQPILTSKVTGLGVLYLLESIRQFSPQSRLVQLSTSELWGNSKAPQNEKTQFAPESPYGVAKLFAHEMCKLYRKSYNLNISCAICGNMEGPRRGREFVTQKIVESAIKIHLGKQDNLKLGNITTKRDWSSVHEIADGIIKLGNSDYREEFVFGSGRTNTIEEFARLAFNVFNLDYQEYIQIDDEFKRPSEVYELKADSRKARKLLNWRPTKTLKEIVQEMVDAALDREFVNDK